MLWILRGGGGIIKIFISPVLDRDRVDREDNGDENLYSRIIHVRSSQDEAIVQENTQVLQKVKFYIRIIANQVTNQNFDRKIN